MLLLSTIRLPVIDLGRIIMENIEKYKELSLEVIVFEHDDVIVTSVKEENETPEIDTGAWVDLKLLSGGPFSGAAFYFA